MEQQLVLAIPRLGATVDELVVISGLTRPQLISLLTRAQRRDVIHYSAPYWCRREAV